ncbi:hypothetical protein E1264_28725 [Actinomadura sp. KC216]|nr:hypothetical protein E1264_28725 [Actinomadura sp. KC216]
MAGVVRSPLRPCRVRSARACGSAAGSGGRRGRGGWGRAARSPGPRSARRAGRPGRSRCRYRRTAGPVPATSPARWGRCVGGASGRPVQLVMQVDAHFASLQRVMRWGRGRNAAAQPRPNGGDRFAAARR